jgi:hypothetical protein
MRILRIYSKIARERLKSYFIFNSLHVIQNIFLLPKGESNKDEPSKKAAIAAFFISNRDFKQTARITRTDHLINKW